MKIRALLADDHTVVRQGLRLLLESEGGIEVVAEARDGREAVDLAVRERPDVVIMDIAMPGLNGTEATRQILERLPGTPVVILSMHETSEHVHRALEAGAMAYLLKESAGAEVMQAIQAVRAGRRFLSAQIADRLAGLLAAPGAKAGGPSPLEQLSAREREILQLVVEGHSSAEIGKALHLSPKTIETYRSRLMHKLAVEDLPALIRFAIAHGLTPPS